MRRKPPLSMVVRCVPGLERIVQSELRALRVPSTLISAGTLLASGVTTRQLYASNALLRCASRILVPAATFVARSFSDLELAIKRIKRDDVLLPSMLIPGARLKIRVKVAAGSPLFHSTAVAERLTRHLQTVSGSSEALDYVQDTPPGDQVEQRLDVHIHGERVRIFVDSSGESLDNRGWRKDRAAKMPLKESVAAGLLRSMGWGDACSDSPSQEGKEYAALLDPFCGSGTIAIEAALLSTGMPAHFLSGRSFALQLWPLFEPGTWGAVGGLMQRMADHAHARRASIPYILGSDRDAGAIASARANALAAGVGDLVEFRQCSISDVEPPSLSPAADTQGLSSVGNQALTRGLMLSNPPWGVRSQKPASSLEDLEHLYRRIGQVHEKMRPNWDLALLVNDRRLSNQVSRRLSLALQVSIGGHRAKLMCGVERHNTDTGTRMRLA